jgi:DNA-binding SARP family transcriptional activator/Flp pilus assembly protein TadD
LEAEFCLLGPLLVRAGNVAMPALPGKQRVLLAALLLHANRMVALDQLAEAIWGNKPPPSARGTLRDYVKELRKQLAVTGESRIATVPGGYVCRIGPGELDVLAFEELRAEARQAASVGAWAQAADRWRAAELLWRGEPLADVPSELLRAQEVPRLAEMRLQAAESRIEADLQLGHHAEVIADLRQLAAVHPLRERLHALLMLALYRDGQQAAAQAVFRSVRGLLVEELGTEPGVDLRQLHHQILAADPALDLPAPAHGGQAVPETAAGQPDGAIVPRQLPAAVSHFTGRTAELDALSGMLSDGSGPRTVVVSALAGTAGVGKTAVAVYWAHHIADRFPDGQLYVNLRGYDPHEPVQPADALAGFLRALGVPGHHIPDEIEERARLYRSRLAGRRMLVLLDNARNGEQVRLLLPGDPGCVAAVTSRDALAGLVATDGARRLDLDVLPLADAVALLRSLIGSRADEDPVAARELARLCARLPLALRIGAELTAARSEVPLSDLVAELAAGRLDLLDAGEDRADVRAVFSWSCRHLPDDVAEAFALIGLQPGTDLDVRAAAALTASTIGRARQVLDQLHRASLLQAAGPGRYGMHDLLRAYAREQAAARDTDGRFRQALTRLFDYYLSAAATAMDTWHPADAHRRPRIPSGAAAGPDMPGQADARAWLDRERANLVAVVVHCADHGWPDHATRLASTLGQYLGSGGHFSEAVTMFGHVLGAARRSGDRAAEATALNEIGRVNGEQGRFQQAGDQFRQALALFRETADRTGQARALGNIGVCEMELGHHEQAARHQEEALAIFRESGDRFGEARAVGNLGVARLRQGCYLEAAGHHQQALDLYREIGDRHGEAAQLGRLGVTDLRLGRHQGAARYLQQALALSREMGDTADQPEILVGLGEAYLRLGRHEQAAGSLEQALDMSREIGDPVKEAEARNRLGDVLFQTGKADKARAHHAAALRLASEARLPREQASAHSGLARVCQADGDSLQARSHWQEALDLYTQLGAPEADQIRGQLTALSPGG